MSEATPTINTLAANFCCILHWFARIENATNNAVLSIDCCRIYMKIYFNISHIRMRKST